MKLEDLIDSKIVDVVNRCISRKRGLVLQKENRMFLLESSDKFECSEIKLRNKTTTLE